MSVKRPREEKQIVTGIVLGPQKSDKPVTEPDFILGLRFQYVTFGHADGTTSSLHIRIPSTSPLLLWTLHIDSTTRTQVGVFISVEPSFLFLKHTSYDHSVRNTSRQLWGELSLLQKHVEVMLTDRCQRTGKVFDKQAQWNKQLLARFPKSEDSRRITRDIFTKLVYDYTGSWLLNTVLHNIFVPLEYLFLRIMFSPQHLVGLKTEQCSSLWDFVLEHPYSVCIPSLLPLPAMMTQHWDGSRYSVCIPWLATAAGEKSKIKLYEHVATVYHRLRTACRVRNTYMYAVFADSEFAPALAHLAQKHSQVFSTTTFSQWRKPESGGQWTRSEKTGLYHTQDASHIILLKSRVAASLDRAKTLAETVIPTTAHDNEHIAEALVRIKALLFSYLVCPTDTESMKRFFTPLLSSWVKQLHAVWERAKKNLDESTLFLILVPPSLKGIYDIETVLRIVLTESAPTHDIHTKTTPQELSNMLLTVKTPSLKKMKSGWYLRPWKPRPSVVMDTIVIPQMYARSFTCIVGCEQIPLDQVTQHFVSRQNHNLLCVGDALYSPRDGRRWFTDVAALRAARVLNIQSSHPGRLYTLSFPPSAREHIETLFDHFLIDYPTRAAKAEAAKHLPPLPLLSEHTDTDVVSYIQSETKEAEPRRICVHTRELADRNDSLFSTTIKAMRAYGLKTMQPWTVCCAEEFRSNELFRCWVHTAAAPHPEGTSTHYSLDNKVVHVGDTIEIGTQLFIVTDLCIETSVIEPKPKAPALNVLADSVFSGPNSATEHTVYADFTQAHWYKPNNMTSVTASLASPWTVQTMSAVLFEHVPDILRCADVSETYVLGTSPKYSSRAIDWTNVSVMRSNPLSVRTAGMVFGKVLMHVSGTDACALQSIWMSTRICRVPLVVFETRYVYENAHLQDIRSEQTAVSTQLCDMLDEEIV